MPAQTPKVGDSAGGGYVVVEVLTATADTASTLTCWCGALYPSKARMGEVREGSTVVWAARETDPDDRILLHTWCVAERDVLHDPVVRAPFGAIADEPGHNGSWIIWRASKREVREYLAERPHLVVRQWARTTTQRSGYTGSNLAACPDVYVEDPADPRCELRTPGGTACMTEASQRLVWDDGEEILACIDCAFKVSGYAPSDLVRVEPLA